MIANREAIYAALFAVVSASAPFVTMSRRLKHWGDLAMEQQPALFMAQKPEGVTQQKGLPSKHNLAVEFFVYAKTGEDESQIPATIINPLIDAIEAALAPDPVLGYFPLIVNGQTISHCWIDGQIDNDEGVLGSQALAIIPVRILAV
jgi:hypothetical protein